MAIVKLENEVMPRIDGPASGFRNKFCRSNPANANPAPAMDAVRADRRRICNITFSASKEKTSLQDIDS